MPDNSQPTTKQWRTFTIAITGQAGAYVITADDSRNIRVPSQPFLWSPTPKQREVVAKLHGDGKVEPEDVAELGKALYEAVFESPNGMKTAFGWAQGDCRKNDEGLRLALRIEPHELSSLPWEAMRDASGLISARPETPLVRTFVGNESQRMDVRGSLRVLFMSATPDHQAAVNVDQTLDRLREDVLKDSLASKRLDIKVEKQVDAKSLRDHLGKRTDHVVLFAGHGEPGEIILQDGTPIVPVEFANALGYDPAVDGANNKDIPTRLVFLMACNTGASFSETDGALAGFAEELARDGGIPAVVAMQTKIGDDNADEFARRFFGAIARFKPVDVAMAEARKEIAHRGRDAIAPVMYLQAKDATLFRKRFGWEPWLIAALVVVLLVVGVFAGQNAYQRIRIEQQVIAEVLRADTAATKEVEARQMAETRQALADNAATKEAEAIKTADYEAIERQKAQATAVAESERASTQTLLASEQQEKAEREERAARANALAKQAQSIQAANEDPSGSLALLLAREAILTTLTTDGYAVPEAETTLRELIDIVPPYLGKLQRPMRQSADIAVMTSDGAGFITGAGSEACLWDLNRGARIRCYDGHTQNIAAIAVNPTGGSFVTGSWDGTARLWNIETGQETCRIDGHSDAIWSVAFDTTGTRLVTAGRDKAVYLWDMTTCHFDQAMGTFRDGVSKVVFSPSGALIAIASQYRVILRDIATTEEIVLRGHTGSIESVAFGSTDDLLATASTDGTARIWNSKTGETLLVLNTRAKGVRQTIDFANNDSSVVTTGTGYAIVWDSLTGEKILDIESPSGRFQSAAFTLTDNIIFGVTSGIPSIGLWNATTGEQTHSVWMEEGGVWDIDFSSDGRFIATAGNRAACVYDSASRSVIRCLGGHFDELTAVSFSPDGKTLATGSRDGTFRIWRIDNGEEIHRFDLMEDVVSVRYDPTGEAVASLTSGGKLTLWDPETGDTKTLIDIGSSVSVARTIFFDSTGETIIVGRGRSVSRYDAQNGDYLSEITIEHEIPFFRFSMAVSPDGQYLLTGGPDDSVSVLWDAFTGERIHEFPGHKWSAHAVAFSPDGAIAATGTAGNIAFAPGDNTIRLWNTFTGDLISAISGHTGYITDLAFSPGEGILASASSDGSVRLWEVPGKSQWILEDSGYNISDATHSSQMVVTGHTDGTIRIWNPELEEVLRLHAHHGPILSLALSPDGDLIVSAGADGALRLWKTQSSQELGGFRGSVDQVTHLEFSSDGGRILSVELDGSVRLWSIETRSLIWTFRGSNHQVNFATLGPDALSFVTTGYDNVARMWEANSFTEIQRFIGHAGPVVTAKLSTDGTTLVTGSLDRTARIWETETGQETARLEGHKGAVRAIDIDSPQSRLVTGGDDGTVRIWSMDTGIEINRLVNLQRPVRSIELVTDDTPVARTITLIVGNDGTARRIVPSPEQVAYLFEPRRGYLKAAFTPDSKHVVAVSGYIPSGQLYSFSVEYLPHASEINLDLWSIGSRTKVTTFSIPDSFEAENIRSLQAVTIDDSGIRATMLQDGVVNTWGTPNETTNDTFEQSNGLSLVEFPSSSLAKSPDGRTIAVIENSFDSWVVTIRDSVTNQLMSRLVGHRAEIRTVMFAPDDKTLVTASNDGTARIWDASTGAQIRLLRGHGVGDSPMLLSHSNQIVESAAYSPDGNWVVTAGMDGTLRLWPSIGQLLESAGRRIQRDPPVFLGDELTRFAIDPIYSTSESLSPAIARIPRNSALIAQIGGGNFAVDVHGNYAYIGMGPRIGIVDIGGVSPISLIAESSVLPGLVSQIKVVNQTVYAITRGRGLYMIDVSDPSDPVEFGHYDIQVASRSLAVVNGIAYMGTNSSELQIVDVSNPNASKPLGKIQLPDGLSGIAVASERAYIATGKSGLAIVDVSDPANPLLVGMYDTPGTANDVAVDGNLAYVADGFMGLQIIDVDDPAVPVLRGSYGNWRNYERIALSGGLAYVFDSESGYRLRILDVRNPDEPFEIGSYLSQRVYGMAESGDRVYMVGSHATLEVVDISEPANPEANASLRISVPSSPNRLVLEGNNLYVVDGSELLIADVSDPSNPVILGFYDTREYILDLVVSNGLAYVISEAAGLSVIDFSNPASPILRGTSILSDGARNIAIADNLALVMRSSDRGNGIQIIDVSNPDDPVAIGWYSTPSFAQAVIASTHVGYVLDERGLSVLNLNDPTDPTTMGVLEHSGARWTGMAMLGGQLILADNRTGTLWIVDITDPANPRQSNIVDIGYIVSLTASDARVYVADLEGNLHVLDISGSANIKRKVISTPSAGALAASDDVVFVAGGPFGGLLIFQP